MSSVASQKCGCIPSQCKNPIRLSCLAVKALPHSSVLPKSVTAGLASNVSPEEAQTKIAQIKQYAQAAGRTVKFSFAISPGIGSPIEMDAIKRYRDAGVDQVIAGGIPSDPKQAKAEIERLAEKLVVPSAKL